MQRRYHLVRQQRRARYANGSLPIFPHPYFPTASRSPSPDITERLIASNPHYPYDSEDYIQYRAQSPPSWPSSHSDDTESPDTVYTYRVYNRLKGHWETESNTTPPNQSPPADIPLPEPAAPYSPHFHLPVAPRDPRSIYREHFRLPVYTNDTDSSYTPSEDSVSESTGSASYDLSEDSPTTSTHSSITIDDTNYIPSHLSTPSIDTKLYEFEFDSTGDFPTLSSSEDSAYTEPLYATQPEDDAKPASHPRTYHHPVRLFNPPVPLRHSTTVLGARKTVAAARKTVTRNTVFTQQTTYTQRHVPRDTQIPRSILPSNHTTNKRRRAIYFADTGKSSSDLLPLC